MIFKYATLSLLIVGRRGLLFLPPPLKFPVIKISQTKDFSERFGPPFYYRQINNFQSLSHLLFTEVFTQDKHFLLIYSENPTSKAINLRNIFKDKLRNFFKKLLPPQITIFFQSSTTLSY